MSVGDRMAGLFPRRPDGAMDPNLAGHPAQNLGSHQGKILRLNDDGSVPADNPFVGRAGALPEIWSYGHRNPQGLAFDPETGTLWETEHGPQGGDELNVIEKGKNYGWPVIGYGANYTLGTEIHASRNKEGHGAAEGVLRAVDRRSRASRSTRATSSRTGRATRSSAAWPETTGSSCGSR